LVRVSASTGQAYKGGPNSRVFLQIIGDEKIDLPFRNRNTPLVWSKPHRPAGFWLFCRRARRACGVHIGKNVKADLGETYQSTRISGNAKLLDASIYNDRSKRKCSWHDRPGRMGANMVRRLQKTATIASCMTEARIP